MPLFSKALPGDVLLSEALSVKALPLAGPSHLLETSTEGYFRLLASPCVSLRLIPPSSPSSPSSSVISRYHPLSHPIASYRTTGLAERPNFAAWTRFLGRPASRLAMADVRLSCRIHVSTVFDILTHKGRTHPVTGQAPPSAPKREKKWFFRKMEWIDLDTQKKQLEQLLQQ